MRIIAHELPLLVSYIIIMYLLVNYIWEEKKKIIKIDFGPNCCFQLEKIHRKNELPWHWLVGMTR